MGKQQAASNFVQRKPASSAAKSSAKQYFKSPHEPQMVSATSVQSSSFRAMGRYRFDGAADKLQTQTGSSTSSSSASSLCVLPSSPCGPHAADIINRSAHDARFWGMLLTEPVVKDFLSRSLEARARQDNSFAKLVVAASAVPREPSRLKASDGAAPADGPSEAAPVVVAGESLPMRRHARPMWPDSEVSLLAKRRRVASGQSAIAPSISQHAVALVANCVPATQACSIGVLTTDLLTEVLAGVDFKTKVCSLLPASQFMRRALQHGAAWDPLCFDKETGRSFLRMLKKHDPLACFAADVMRTKGLLPDGFFDVRCLRVVLMDPERVEQAQSDTEEEEPKPRPLAIADPLDEVCRRLRHYFTGVKEFLVSNIEDFRMDYRFLGLRAGSLSKFGFVELSCCDSSPTRTYTLFAKYDSPPRLIDISSAISDNRSRLPSDVHLEDGTTFSEREALYLAEHRSAFKNADCFHFQHAKFRTVRSHAVRKSYVGVVASLRERFPERFADDSDPRSPPALRRPAHRP